MESAPTNLRKVHLSATCVYLQFHDFLSFTKLSRNIVFIHLLRVSTRESILYYYIVEVEVEVEVKLEVEVEVEEEVEKRKRESKEGNSKSAVRGRESL